MKNFFSDWAFFVFVYVNKNNGSAGNRAVAKKLNFKDENRYENIAMDKECLA